jgi:hypothetical protein
MRAKKGLIFVKSVKPITLVPILENDKPSECFVCVSEILIKKWKIKDNDDITISIGKQYILLKLYEKKIKDDEIQLSQSSFLQMNLPIQIYNFTSYFNETTRILYLAPLIGLLTEINDEDPSQPNFKSVHSFCEELEHVTQRLGGFFFVLPLQHFSSDYITGYFFQEDKWNKCKLPIPDVIYNRIHSRRLEASPAFQQFRKQLQVDQIPMFNNRFLSKWEVYDVLMTEAHLQPFIPISKLYSRKNLEEMVSDHAILFLKPIHGSQGRNIIRIEQKDYFSQLDFSYFKEKQNTLIVHNIDELHETLAPYMRTSTYLIQQGIPFIHYQNRHMDFRILCHKNHQDAWIVTSVVARFSADKQFVSNIARGGETMRPLKALSLFFDSKTSKQQYLFIQELALEFASTISQNSEGLTGELGIDIGIDMNGNPWIIEANSKPSKNFEEQEIKIRPSAKAIISYCQQLAIDHCLKKEENKGGDIWNYDLNG